LEELADHGSRVVNGQVLFMIFLVGQGGAGAVRELKLM